MNQNKQQLSRWWLLFVAVKGWSQPISLGRNSAPYGYFSILDFQKIKIINCQHLGQINIFPQYQSFCIPSRFTLFDRLWKPLVCHKLIHQQLIFTSFLWSKFFSTIPPTLHILYIIIVVWSLLLFYIVLFLLSYCCHIVVILL